MKVLFIWIENYKGLSNLGLNFSNEYNISFNKGTNTLSIEDNEDYIEGFFGNKISNLTAIVGKNGVGKSSIISFWTNYLIRGNDPTDKSFILYTKDTDDLHLCCAKDNPLIDNKTSKLLNNNNKWPKCDHIVNINNNIDASSPFSESDFFSFRELDESHEQTNLTSLFLLSLNPSNDMTKSYFDAHFNSFTTEEYKRIIRLVKISFSDIEGNLYIKSVKLPKYIKLDLQLVNNSSIIRPASEHNSPFEEFILNLFWVYFDAIIKTNEKIYHEAPSFYKDDFSTELLKKVQDSYESIVSIFNTYKNDNRIPFIDQVKEIVNQFTKVDIIYSNLKTNINILNKLVNKLLCLKSDSYNVHEQMNNSITFNLNKSTHSDINEILDYLNQFDFYVNTHTLTFCHNQGGRSISSGEYQLLTTLGRLNSIFENGEQKNSYTILLDEIDIGLHPQWQKEIIKHLIDFINENEAFARQTIQGEKVNKPFIQLIITSHSPFVLSDIPKNCVLLLDRKGDEVVIKSLQKSHNTFGMNIHELFTDSFFLQDGLMGEFARTEIHKLIERINNEKKPITADFYEECKKRIQIIGEPFLRKKIMELLHSKLEKKRIDEVIRQKEKELENLKRLKNND